MDTSFMTNSLNTLIVAITVIIIALIIVWLSTRKNVQLTKEGVKIIDPYPYDILATEIPGIDEWLKNKLRAVLLDNVDTLFGRMVGLDPIVRQMLLLGVLDELSQRISINGFAKLLCSEQLRETWCIDRKGAILAKVTAHANNVSTDSVNRAIDDVLDFIVHEFALRTKMACEKKILVYEKHVKKAPKRIKYLIRKNTTYIEGLKSV